MTEVIFDHDRRDVCRLATEYISGSFTVAKAMKFNGVTESQAEYNAIADYEHEHCCAEHEEKREPRQ